MAVMKRILANGRTVRAKWSSSSTEQTRATATIPGLANNQLPEIRLRALNEATLKMFMPIFQERLKKNLQEFQIGYEGDLDDSIRFSVSKGADSVMGTLRFNFYGRFVDWGVGKGITLLESQSGVPLAAGRMRSKRSAKPWFGPQYAYEQKRLRELATTNTQQVLAELAAEMNVQVEIQL